MADKTIKTTQLHPDGNENVILHPETQWSQIVDGDETIDEKLEAIETTVEVDVQQTETLDPDEDAYVVNSGTSTNVSLNFGIPRGYTGYGIWASNIEPIEYSGTYNLAINKANLYGYTDRTPQVNDIFITPNGDIYQIMIINDDVLEVTYRTTVKGEQGDQGYSGLSIYDVAANITTSGTTVDDDAFTVPSGFTVQVGDLCIGTDGILGQVYSIVDGQVTIRYIMNLLLSSDTYVTLTSNQIITGDKKSEIAPRIQIDIKTGTWMHICDFKFMTNSWREKAGASIWGGFAPSPMNIICFRSVGTGYLYCDKPIDGIDIYYYWDSSALMCSVYIYNTAYATDTFYSMFVGYPSERCSITWYWEQIDEPENKTVASYEVSHFMVGDGLKASVSGRAAACTLSVDGSISTTGLYEYNIILYYGSGSTSTNTIIVSFRIFSRTSLSSYFTEDGLVGSSLADMVSAVDDDTGFIPANGTYYNATTALSYMIVRLRVNKSSTVNAANLFYISSDARGTLSSIQIYSYTFSYDCTEISPTGTVTNYSASV